MVLLATHIRPVEFLAKRYCECEAVIDIVGKFMVKNSTEID